MAALMPKKKKTPWYIAGLNFDCLQCSACCSGPDAGYIWVTRNEVQLIADFLKSDPGQVRKKYLKRIGMRTTIIEHPKTKDLKNIFRDWTWERVAARLRYIYEETLFEWRQK